MSHKMSLMLVALVAFVLGALSTTLLPHGNAAEPGEGHNILQSLDQRVRLIEDRRNALEEKAKELASNASQNASAIERVRVGLNGAENSLKNKLSGITWKCKEPQSVERERTLKGFSCPDNHFLFMLDFSRKEAQPEWPLHRVSSMRCCTFEGSK